MYGLDLYRRVRLACHHEGLSGREAARRFGIDRKTVAKILAFSVPPGYRRRGPPRRPKLEAFTGIIDRILEEDQGSHRKQRHTAKKIFERLQDEYGFTGGYTIVKEYVRERRRRSREMFVPLTHLPGHAQIDFGEAMAVIGAKAQKVHFFAFDLPHSDASFVKALYAAANIILTRSVKWSSLKAWGARLARSKGRKRALVAIARKLAVILHAMWIDGTPFSFTEPEAAS